MLLIRKNGATSNILRATLRHSSTGQGLTGLAFSSSGLIISTICDNEATATAYTAAGSTIETITTLGTFAAPTATKCRFKEVDATNHPGLYEFQFSDARFAVANAKTLRVTVTGATNLLSRDIFIQLTSMDVDDAVRGGMTAFPNVASGSAGALIVSGTGTAALSVSSGVAQADVAKVNNVSTSSVTTINANIGTTQPVNYTGTGASALVKSDMVDIKGTAVTESGAGRLAAAFSTQYDVAAPVFTAASVNQTGDSFARIGATGSGLTTLATAASITTLTTNVANVQADTDDIQTRLPAALSSGNMKVDVFAMQNNVVTAAAIADGAIDEATFAADTAKYQAKLGLIDDDSGTSDRYVVSFFKNGQPITSGISGTPTIQIIKVADGSNLLAATNMTQIGSTTRWRHTETSSRIVDGALYVAVIIATINSVAMTWEQWIGRDT